MGISESAIAGNTAGAQGGGILNYDFVALRGTGVTGNTAGQAGGGSYNEGGSVFLGQGASVAGNTPDDCVGTPGC